MHGMQRINASGADVFISQNCFAWGKNWIWIEQKVFGTWWTVYFIFKRIEKFKMHQLLSPSELVRLFWWRKKYFGLLRLFFRELRSHFVDVAVAHEAGCHKLDDLGKVSLQWILSKLTDYMEFFFTESQRFSARTIWYDFVAPVVAGRSFAISDGRKSGCATILSTNFGQIVGNQGHLAESNRHVRFDFEIDWLTAMIL